MDHVADRDTRDREAVRAILAGHREVYREIVHRYTDPLYSLALRMTGVPEDAEEALQEIFTRAYTRLDSFDPERRFFPWLYTIALNVLRSRERSAAHQEEKNTVSLGGTLERVVPSSGERPEKALLRREAGEAIERALRDLRREHREVFILRHQEGFSVAEVAEILGIPENTVKTYARRAREQLKEAVVAHGWGRPQDTSDR
jgi:RNA polymerase sigma-70 factor, ECF subfamily